MDEEKKKLLFSLILTIIPLADSIFFVSIGGINWAVVIISFILIFVFFFYTWGFSFKKILSNFFAIIFAFVFIFIVAFEAAALRATETKGILRDSQIVILLTFWTLFYEFYFRKILDFSLIKYISGDAPFREKNWISKKTTRAQNIDYREVNLRGRLIKSIQLSINPRTDFWRAGFKICDPNSFIVPLRSERSLLIHLGSNAANENIGMSVYLNGESFLHKSDIGLVKNLSISLRFNISEKNFASFYVNNTLQFEKKIDSNIRKKLYLAAWTDGNEGSVEFKNTTYTIAN